ncbi:MAG: magnesium chelatase subunit D [Myxococcota bacterium]
MTDPAEAWTDALRAAMLFAVDPSGLGGVWVRSPAGVVRDRWWSFLEACLPDHAPIRRVPTHVTEDRLLGGLDLGRTLRTGRLVSERGVLAEAHGGVVLLPMAERHDARSVAHLCRVLDRSELHIERDGIQERRPIRLGAVAFDEGLEDEVVSAALRDRLAIHVDLSGLGPRDAWIPPAPDPLALDGARRRLAQVRTSDEALQSLCKLAFALGIESLRAPFFAMRAGRAAAALDERDQVDEADLTDAARVVLAPRATRSLAPEEESQATEPPPESKSPDEPAASGDEMEVRPLEDMLLAAVRSALPSGLLAGLLAREAALRGSRQGASGVLRAAAGRGRPAGIRPVRQLRRDRLHLVETLRAAAPWQMLRGRDDARVRVRPQDFRTVRRKRPTESTTIFSVDASGSSALQRLAEAKGAVEQVLNDCYVRRDHVALIGFRGKDARLVLPPTRSLVRAKRCLAGLPGGGTTPLAAGIDAALVLAEAVRRRGQTPVLVFMTDGRANIARDGTPGRGRAAEDALASARAVKAARIATLFVDTAPRAQPSVRALADAMGARYLPLPYCEAGRIAADVRRLGGGGD